MNCLNGQLDGGEGDERIVPVLLAQAEQLTRHGAVGEDRRGARLWELDCHPPALSVLVQSVQKPAPMVCSRKMLTCN